MKFRFDLDKKYEVFEVGSQNNFIAKGKKDGIDILLDLEAIEELGKEFDLIIDNSKILIEYL